MIRHNSSIFQSIQTQTLKDLFLRIDDWTDQYKQTLFLLCTHVFRSLAYVLNGAIDLIDLTSSKQGQWQM